MRLRLRLRAVPGWLLPALRPVRVQAAAAARPLLRADGAVLPAAARHARRVADALQHLYRVDVRRAVHLHATTPTQRTCVTSLSPLQVRRAYVRLCVCGERTDAAAAAAAERHRPGQPAARGGVARGGLYLLWLHLPWLYLPWVTREAGALVAAIAQCRHTEYVTILTMALLTY